MPPPKDRLPASPGGVDPNANANADADADTDTDANLARVRQISFPLSIRLIISAVCWPPSSS